MLHPVTWRLQPSARPRNLYDQSRHGQASASGTFHPSWAPTASANWTPSIAARVQDFIPPAALQPVQNPSRDGHIWSNVAADSGLSLNSTFPDMSVHGTSNLSRLPFFMSQVLKQENGAVKPEQQSSKGKPAVVKSESTPHVSLTNLPQLSVLGVDQKLEYSSSDLSQAACFPGIGKQAFDFMQQGLGRQSPQPVRVHIQSLKQPHAIEAALPYSLSGGVIGRLPKVIAPASPELVRSALSSMKPMIVYAQYQCDARCRSRGICVHFSFLLGCRQVPDGLICLSCQNANVHRPYAAHRICPRHNKRSLSQFTPNLAEDYLPSAAQLQRAFEILNRACDGHWGGVPSTVSKRAHDTTVGHNQHIHGIEDTGDQVDGGDNVLPSIEANHHGTEHARKRQKTSADVEAKARKGSSDKENDFEGRSGSALHGSLGNCSDQVGDGKRTPQVSRITEDRIEAGAMADDELFSVSLPPWSPEPRFDLFS